MVINLKLLVSNDLQSWYKYNLEKKKVIFFFKLPVLVKAPFNDDVAMSTSGTLSKRTPKLRKSLET